MPTRALKNKSLNFLHALIKPHVISEFLNPRLDIFGFIVQLQFRSFFSKKINKKYCIDETNPAISELTKLGAIFSLLTKKAVQKERHFL